MGMSNDLNVYLINLDRDTERFEQISGRLHECGIAFERVSAILGSEINQGIINNITYPRNHFKTKVLYTRSLLKSEIGCFLSHKKAWSRLLESGKKYGLILEDDIRASKYTLDFLSDLSWIPKGIDVIQVAKNTIGQQKIKISKSSINLNNSFRLVRPVSSSLGAMGYIISRNGASAALRLSEKIFCPVDDFLFSPWFQFYYTSNYLKLVPALIEPKDGVDSSIGDRSKGKIKNLKAPFYIRHNPIRFILDMKYKMNCLTGVECKCHFAGDD